MKKLILIIGLFILAGCRKIEMVPPQVIDLGKVSTTTAIRSSRLVNNTLNIEFATTTGSKYSVQVIPFGSETPIFKDGFTAEDTLIKKSYDFTKLKRMNYDLIFIDVKGTEQKIPLLIN